MHSLDLLALLLLTRAALPDPRRSGDGMVVNITSAAARIGMPFYATCAAAKTGLVRFGEAMWRELKGDGVHLLTVYPGATDNPTMAISQAGPEGGFSKEPASAVADVIVDGIESGAMEVVRGRDVRAKMIQLNRDDPAALDERFIGLKPALERAVRDYSAL